HRVARKERGWIRPSDPYRGKNECDRNEKRVADDVASCAAILEQVLSEAALDLLVPTLPSCIEVFHARMPSLGPVPLAVHDANGVVPRPAAARGLPAAQEYKRPGFPSALVLPSTKVPGRLQSETAKHRVLLPLAQVHRPGHRPRPWWTP